jgi:non-homologous end joining protein Ku
MNTQIEQEVTAKLTAFFEKLPYLLPWKKGSKMYILMAKSMISDAIVSISEEMSKKLFISYEEMLAVVEPIGSRLMKNFFNK